MHYFYLKCVICKIRNFKLQEDVLVIQVETTVFWLFNVEQDLPHKYSYTTRLLIIPDVNISLGRLLYAFTNIQSFPFSFFPRRIVTTYQQAIFNLTKEPNLSTKKHNIQSLFWKWNTVNKNKELLQFCLLITSQFAQMRDHPIIISVHRRTIFTADELVAFSASMDKHWAKFNFKKSMMVYNRLKCFSYTFSPDCERYIR